MKRFMLKIKNAFKKNPYKFVFYSIGILFLLIFFISILISHGNTSRNYLFGNNQDTFMDYFNSVWDTFGRRPYDNGVIYPPLCYVIYFLCSRFILIEHVSVGRISPDFYRESMFSFLIYSLIIILILIYSIYKLKKGNIQEKRLFCLLILFSLPFLFAFERANIVIVSFIFLLIFINFKDSENKILKEIALISLAASAAIKIYPAIFGLLLIKEEKWKELIRVIIYGLILFFIPFIFFGGSEACVSFIKNLINTTGQVVENTDINKLNFSALFDFISKSLNISDSKFELISKIFCYILVIISCISSLITKKQWKCILLLTLLMIGIPGISYTYAAIFLIIPIIMYLDDCNKTKFDYIYLLLFLLIMFPNPLALLEKRDFDYFNIHISWNSIIIIFSVMIMTITLNIDILYNKIKKDNKLEQE